MSGMRSLQVNKHHKTSNILNHADEVDKLLYLRFKLEHAARNLPMLVELIYKAS